MKQVTLELDVKAALGEGPFWHPEEKQLYWVDIESRKVNRFTPDTGKNKTVEISERVGFAVPKKKGGLLIGTDTGIKELDFSSGEVIPIMDPEANLQDNRFNDGKCDPAGRLWAGTMSTVRKREAGSLYRMDTDYSVQQIFSSITTSNGLAWNGKQDTMYYIDTATQRVDAAKYNRETGEVSERTAVITVPEELGHPDGMTIDREDKLWVAMFYGRCITRWDPESGKLLEKVDLPVKNVTSACFGGTDYRTLYITTASIAMTDEEKKKFPSAGSLFSIRTNVPGLPMNLFNG